ncbi:MAG: glycerate kinase [Clostridiales bacterium]|nr:glycerate kinase [Clostridiales bacterium]
MSIRQDADRIMQAALKAAQPDTAVRQALDNVRFDPEGRLVLVAIGKAAWQMAKAAHDALGRRIDAGIVITKHGHGQGKLGRLLLREAGHPVPDQSSFAATREAIALVQGLSARDSVLLLISGGGSALFEQPLIDPAELQGITQQLLKSGADIVEMNTIRKRLSAVKGGRFAQQCAPATVHAVVLSDIIGDPLDMIASGPAWPDASTSADALRVANKYQLALSPDAAACLRQETPKALDNVHSLVTGSVKVLCAAAAHEAKALGYEPLILTASLSCQAREAGSFLAAIAQYHQDSEKSLCFIAGGETVVKLTGTGLGGRNQELALSAAQGIAGLRDTAVFSLGSDGTDGPTDAAGGYCDQDTAARLAAQGIDIHHVLQDNDAYHALDKIGGLIMTGPTGTNVNDVSVVLIKR